MSEQVIAATAEWYAAHARPLPWREPDATPWGVMVSEFMLQQTPVVRVLPVWLAWMERWPTPDALAAEEPGEAVRAWGRLGYPRRAQRLHAAASVIVAEHGGRVPSDVETLRSLPGVGDYTAAAIASFAFQRRAVVLDTNVRRVLARVFTGVEFPANAVTKAERELAASVLPDAPADAALWSVASMELGAQICTATTPACERCPVRTLCAWHQAGRPPHDGPPRRGQAYAGTDRQCRGILLGVLRASDAPVPRAQVLAAWASDPEQAERALASLLDDGLVTATDDGRLRL